MDHPMFPLNTGFSHRLEHLLDLQMEDQAAVMPLINTLTLATVRLLAVHIRSEDLSPAQVEALLSAYAGLMREMVSECVEWSRAQRAPSHPGQ